KDSHSDVLTIPDDTDTSSSGHSSSVTESSPPQANTSKEDAERAQRLTQAPFTNIATLIDSYNLAIQEGNHELAGDMGDVIRGYVIPEIVFNNPAAIWQCVTLMSCNDPGIV